MKALSVGRWIDAWPMISKRPSSTHALFVTPTPTPDGGIPTNGALCLCRPVMRECVLILALSALVGCSAPHAGSCRAWSEDRQSLASQTASFQPGSSTLNAEAKAKVAVVARYMTTNPVVAVRIEGHGDGRGTDTQNYELGERRAQALRAGLVQLGVDFTRLDTRACSAPPTKWRCADFVLLIPPQ
jgi:hypothetical protein